MKVVRVRNEKDLAAGLLFVAFGVAGLWMSRHHALGTAVRMGPAYFPLLVSGVLTALGTLLCALAMVRGCSRIQRPAARPLLAVSAGVVAFAFLVRTAGLVVATVAVIILTSLAGGRFRARDVGLLALVLAAFAAVVFVYGLGLPIRVWPW